MKTSQLTQMGQREACEDKENYFSRKSDKNLVVMFLGCGCSLPGGSLDAHPRQHKLQLGACGAQGLSLLCRTMTSLSPKRARQEECEEKTWSPQRPCRSLLQLLGLFQLCAAKGRPVCQTPSLYPADFNCCCHQSVSSIYMHRLS